MLSKKAICLITSIVILMLLIIFLNVHVTKLQIIYQWDICPILL